MNKKFFIQTFGCQMNEHDSEIIAGMLTDMGMEQWPERDSSDIVFINTCSVRENADKRFFGTLGQLKRIKEARPDFVVGVCGCMMQQQHVIDEIKTKYPWVDIIFGTHNIQSVPRLVQSVLDNREHVVEVWDEAGDMPEDVPARRLFRHKSFVNIMYGCNNFCTYCIVPYTRGRERSRAPKDIVREIEQLASDGVREVTLLGQNVNSYRGGSETGAPVDFAELIGMIDGIDGIERIRFMTSHPKDLSDDLIRAYSSCVKLCHNIHLPVQSGSSRVLARMNRRYTREHYLELVAGLRAECPDITISTDIIVGFPGETAKDFDETLSLVRQVRFDSAFTFLYSIRKGTPAERYDEQIPEDIKHERFNRLVDAINCISAEKNDAYVGTVQDVLVDGRSKTDITTYTGRTDGFKLVNFRGSDDMTGQIVPVRITKSKTFSLWGEVME